MPKFPFRSISWEQIDRFPPNFIYASILTRSSLGLLHVIFRTFVSELWPSIYAKILFPLNITRTNWLIFTKFYICLNIDKIELRIVTPQFSYIVPEYPWFMPKFRFLSISRELFDWLSPNFIYAFILTRSSLGLMHVIIRTFVPGLWPLIYAKISFPLLILRTNW